MEEIKQIVDQIGGLNAHLEEQREALAKKADESLVKEAEARIVADMVPKFQALQAEQLKRDAESKAFNDALLDKLDEIENRGQRLGSGGADNKHAEQRQAMRSYMLAGDKGHNVLPYIPIMKDELRLQGLESRILQSNVDTKGGFLVDLQTENEIVKNAVLIDPVRANARVTTLASGDTLKIKTRTGTPTGYWPGQGARPTASQSAYGALNIPAEWLGVEIEVTRDMLRDVQGFESEIIADATEQIAYTEGLAFVAGTGVGQPTGFAVNTGVTHTTGADAANDLLHPDDFATLLTTLKAPYRARAKWGFNSTVLGKVLKMKDQNDNYLWQFQNGVASGIPTSILGLPFILCESMDSDGTNALLPLILADWASFYRIVDRQGIELIRDESAAKPDIQFGWYKRVGGNVDRAEAGKMIVV